RPGRRRSPAQAARQWIRPPTGQASRNRFPAGAAEGVRLPAGLTPLLARPVAGKELHHQEVFEPRVVGLSRGEVHFAAEAMRLPDEVLALVVADDLDHAAHPP